MKRNNLKRVLVIALVLCLTCLLGACSRLANIKLPPLPTPSDDKPDAISDAFAMDAQASPAPEQGQQLIPPGPIFSPTPTPEIVQAPPTPTPTPAPTPTPTPVPENPNVPHLFIENATYPRSMDPGGVAELYGDITVDKGLIALVRGRIYNNDTGEDVQICNFYPYTDTFSLAGSVNAQLIFGVLPPGHYSYIVTAIAENNNFSSGNVVLIEHAFEIYYP